MSSFFSCFPVKAVRGHDYRSWGKSILALGDSPQHYIPVITNDDVSSCSFARQNATVYCLISDQIRIELKFNSSKPPQDFLTQKTAWESKGAFHL